MAKGKSQHKPTAASCTLIIVMASLTALSIIYWARTCGPEEWKSYAMPRWDLDASKRAVLPRDASWPGGTAIIEQNLVVTESTRMTATQHSATIAEVAPGEFLAAWFGGSWERNPDVAIWASRYLDGHWSPEPWIVATDKLGGTACWNPVLLHLPATGQTLLFYKVGGSPSTWRPLIRRSFDKGVTWSAPESLRPPLLGPAKNKPLVLPDGKTLIAGASDEVSLSMVEQARAPVMGAGKHQKLLQVPGRSSQHKPPRRGTGFLPYGADERLGPKRHLVEGWHSWVEVSEDGGFTWQRQKGIEFKGNLIQPALFYTKRRGFGMLLRPQTSGYTAAAFSSEGLHWSPAKEIPDLPNPNSGLDAVGLEDGRVVAVYNPVGWAESRAVNATGRHKLVLGVSDDGGVSWRQAVTLEDRPEELTLPSLCCNTALDTDRNAMEDLQVAVTCAAPRMAEYSYPSVIQATNGMIHVIYTYSYGPSKRPCSGRENLKHVVLDPEMI